MSIVWRLYKAVAHPLVKIVCGLQTSWEHSIATMRFDDIDSCIWSPCSSFIAVSCSGPRTTIAILDAVTLAQLTTLESPLDELDLAQWLIFSPDGHLLTWCGCHPQKFISWDVQTGVLVSTISSEEHSRHVSLAAHSSCGTMLGILFYLNDTNTIYIYNTLSGTCICTHSVKGPQASPIWADGECFQFSMKNSGSLTIWEVGFTSTCAPIEVESLHIPDNPHSPYYTLFHPTPSRLALVTQGKVLIWDPQNSKFLLDFDSVDLGWTRLSFSPDGQFFACGVANHGIYLWKESPTGYILHQKFIPGTEASESHISPNGELIIVHSDLTIHLWRITDSATSPTAISTQAFQHPKSILLEFSPDKASAAVAQVGDGMVTLLDLKSGTPQLTIDTSMEVYGLGLGESTIIVVGDGKIVTWNLPSGDCVPNPRVNIDNSIWTTTFNFPSLSPSTLEPAISVSPNFHYIAILMFWVESVGEDHMHLLDAHTGQCFGSVDTKVGSEPWFTPDGHEVWCVKAYHGADRWKIVEGTESNATELEYLGLTENPPDESPWKPSGGYEITDDRWILTPGGKRLLWFSPYWRSYQWERKWGGQFLVLLHCKLQSPVILELE